MRILIICVAISLVFLTACLSCKSEQKTEVKKPDIKIKVGWIDPNTYSVTVTGATEPQAITKAKHKILKDIVTVRIRSQSRYTDISKIKDEFEKPLRDGKVIKSFNDTAGLKIIFQIRDKDLKKKFERK